MAETGLRLCGMADDPPRPAPDGSASSATSPCAISDRSVAIFDRLPVQTATSQPRRSHSSRWVCQGAGGSASFRSSAMRRATAAPASPMTLSVPTAPPSCSASARPATWRSCSRERTIGASQLAHFRPKLVTTAGCSSVRASTGVAACCSARSSRCPASASSSASSSASAWRVASTMAVSITSWLVLPRWTLPAACASTPATRAVSSLTSGIARLPARPLAATSASRSYSSALQTLAMTLAAPAGIKPSAACARDSAASKSNIPWTIAVSPNTAATAGAARKLSKIGVVTAVSGRRQA